MTNIPEDFTGVITFSKTVQPKQYESERVEITVATSDGDDVDFSLDMIRRIAYNHLGVIATFTAYAEEEPAPAPVVEEAPKKRKRRTKAEIEADKARDEAYKAGVTMAESGNDAEGVAAYEAAQSKADDARRAVVAEKVAEKVEVETPPAETASAPSVQEVADWAGKAAKKTTAGEVMQLMKDRFGVARLGSIPEDKRADAIELLKAIAIEEDEIPY